MSPLDKAKVLDSGCPQCGARSGEPCKSRTGRLYLRPYFHVHRRAVLDAWLAKPRRGLPNLVVTRPCPRCGAKPGERCRSRDGRLGYYFHTPRRALVTNVHTN